MLDLIETLTVLLMIIGVTSGTYSIYYLLDWNYIKYKRGVFVMLTSGGLLIAISILVKIIYILPVSG